MGSSLVAELKHWSSGMSKMKHKDLRKKLIGICRQMNELGINQGTAGNVSVRIDGGFLISASGVPYEKMKPEHVVQMDFEGGYYGDILPSVEWRMHRDILVKRPEANSVLHVHSTYASALSTLRKDIPAFHYMIGVAGGNSIRVAEYQEYGTEELSVAMLKAMEGRSSCLLANHGQIGFGPSLEKALWLAVEVEALCHQYWAASLIGKPVLMTESEMNTVLRRFPTYGKQMGETSGDLKSLLAKYAPVKRAQAAPPKTKLKRKP
jgi:L-fuculose-phosphate aldolase